MILNNSSLQMSVVDAAKSEACPEGYILD